jgi:lambda repressor-like predicted transcriptional regulator
MSSTSLSINQIKTQKGMTSQEIKSELILRGISIKNIADQAGVTGAAVTQTINQYPYSRYKGLRIRGYIAEALGKNIDDIWPPATG